MDQALSQARRRFLGVQLERNGIRVPGNHPYFWAGIAYLGWPGQRLYPVQQPVAPLAVTFCVLPLLIGIVLLANIKAKPYRT